MPQDMPPFPPRFTVRDVRVEERRPLHHGHYRLDEYRLRHRRHDGTWSPLLAREVFTPGDSVAVVLYDPATDMVVLVEQFRIGPLAHGDDPWLIEIVAGRIGAGETPQQVARREAEEEAGCRIERLLPLPAFHASPGAVNEFIHMFCGLVDARGIGGVHGLAEEHEDIRAFAVPLGEALAALDSGRLNSAPTVIGLQWLALRRDAIRAALPEGEPEPQTGRQTERP